MRPLVLAAVLLTAMPAAAQQSPQAGDGAPIGPGARNAREAMRASPPTIMAEPVALMIAAFDADGDARVSRAEFDAGVARVWAKADPGASGIGYIAFADWEATWIGDANALPSPFETDHDGDNRITGTEFAGRMARFFDKFDADKGGDVTRKELLTIAPSMLGPERGRMRGGRQGMRP